MGEVEAWESVRARVQWAGDVARTFNQPQLMDTKGRAISNAWCRAFKVADHSLAETQYTDANGDATFSALGDADDVYILCMWGKRSRVFLSEAPPSTAELSGDLDDISDGSTYKKTTTNEKTGASRGYAGLDASGDLARTIVDAWTYYDGVTSRTVKSMFNRDTHDADNVGESATKKWAGETGADLTASHESATVAALTGLDADNLAESATKKWAAESDATVGAKCGTNLVKSDDSSLGDADVITKEFKTAASPNARIEITTTEIVGYSDATTKQFYLQASDGKGYFGAGSSWLDAAGITIKGQQLKLLDTDAAYTNYLYTDASGDLQITLDAGGTGYIYLSNAILQTAGLLTEAIRPITTQQYSVGGTGTGTDGPFGSMAALVYKMRETTTPTAVNNYGALYTKSDNKLYFQSGDNTEHEVAYVP